MFDGILLPEPRVPGAALVRPAVLLVDDEEPIRAALQRLLRREPYRLLTARTAEEGLAALGEGPVAVVVSDQRMPGMSGTQFLRRVRETSPDTLRILLTGFADLAAALAAINEAEVYRFLAKPWDDEDLRLTIRQAVRQYMLVDENRRLARLTQEQNEALRRLNASLEQRVAERTREVEAQLQKLQAAQALLVRAERLSAVGELVAGVAHELNNPLTSIVGFAELLMAGTLEPKAQQWLESLHGEALRCARIVQNLLTFARQRRPEHRACRVNEIVSKTVELRAYHLQVDGIRVSFDLAADLPETPADPHQLQQVFLNLLNNAHQAMEPQGGGELVIATRCLRGPVGGDGNRGADRIQVTFHDSGPGIPPGVRERMFEPFFTTKPIGEGTGLGLSICYGILREHGGDLWLDEVARGARFVVELPVRVGADENAPAPGPGAPEAALRRGTRILLVDDEANLLAACRELLELDGVVVSAVGSAEEALRRLAAEAFDLVISDLKMPGMDGRALYREIGRRHPSMAGRVLFISGDTRTRRFAGFPEPGGAPCLAKPFTIRELRAAIREALEGGAAAAVCPDDGRAGGGSDHGT